MGKLYILIAIIYAISKALNTLEIKKVRIFGEFLKNLLLFPLAAIMDIVKWATKDTEDEDCGHGRRRDR